MKIFRKNESGSVLMLGLVTAATLMLGLASYFALVQAQNGTVVRSQSWNSAIPAAEAGIEDALTHLNVVGDGSRATNGFTLHDGNYTATRQLPNFRYTLSIDSSNQPTIYSTGYVRAPKSTSEIARVIRVQTTRYGAGMRGMVALGNVTMNGNCDADSFDGADPLHSTNGNYDATKRKDGSYVGSVMGSVDTGGGKINGYMATGGGGSGSGTVGDFAWNAANSGIQPGHYQKDLNVSFPPATAPFNGGASFPETGVSIITTNYTYGTAVITTNALPNPLPAGGVATTTNTYTQVAYPTGQSSITTNTAATSSKTYPAAGTYVGNIVTRVVTSGNPSNRGTWYDYQQITGYSYKALTYSYTQATTNYTTSTATYSYALRSGNYQMDSLSMSGGSSMIILGDAVFYVVGDFSMTGNAQMTIVPGASLKIYVGGGAHLAGNGILNQNADTTKFSYYGLPGNTSLDLSGNASFTGSIYAPNADFSLNGGGNNDYDLVGASVTKTVSMHGHFHFHYDERLGRNGGAAQYRVASWNEM